MQQQCRQTVHTTYVHEVMIVSSVSVVINIQVTPRKPGLLPPDYFERVGEEASHRAVRDASIWGRGKAEVAIAIRVGVGLLNLLNGHPRRSALLRRLVER